MRKNSKGLVPLLFIVIAAALVAALFMISYYLLRTSERVGQIVPPGRPYLPSSPAPISDSDEVSVIEKELEETDLGSPDADFGELDSQATSL